MRLRGMLADTRPLQVPAFRRLWTAGLITTVGAQLSVVAVPAQLYAMTGSSAYVGLAGLFGLVPLVVFGLWGGALADAMDRRTLLIVSTLGLVATAVLLWAQAALGNRNVWLLLGIFALQQASYAVNHPTRNAVLPRILDAELLPAANSLTMTVSQAGAIAGPLLGGALIPLLGLPWLYFIDAVTLFATVTAAVALPPLPVQGIAGAPGLRSIVDGLAYLTGHPILLMSFLVDIIAMVFGMPRALFPEMADVSFGGPGQGGFAFAVLYAGIPLGAVLGGVFSGWVSRVTRHGLAVVIAILVWGAAMTGFGLAGGAAGGRAGGYLALAAAMLVLGGAADIASAAFRVSMLQAAASDDVRGRLQGIFIVVVVGGPRIADVAHGGAAAVAGTTVAASAGGVLVIVLTLAAAAVVPSFVRYRAAGHGA